MEYDIGSKIKAARIEKGLTQEQIAELLGVSRQTISNWENEKLLQLSRRKYECCKKQHQQKQNYYHPLLSADLGVCNDCVLVLYKRKRRYGLQFDVPLDYPSCSYIHCVCCYW